MVSIIIPTRNRSNQLKLCLETLTKQLDKNDEVLVIDNQSLDNTKDTVQSFSKNHKVKYLSETRVGPSFARNLGVEQAKGNVLAFLDDDCIVSGKWLEMIKNMIRSHYADEDLVFQGKIRNKFPSSCSFYGKYLDLKNGLALGEIKLTKEWKRGKYINFLNAGNFYLKRSVLGNIRFDGLLFPFIGEERDLAYRLQISGIKIIFTPEVSVVHNKVCKPLLMHIRTSFFYGKAQGILEAKYLTSRRKQKIFSEYGPILFKQNNFKESYVKAFNKQFDKWNQRILALIYHRVTSISYVLGRQYGFLFYSFKK